MTRMHKIIQLLEEEDEASGSRIAEILGISRQAVNRYLKKLVLDGKVTKLGKTRGAVYLLQPPKPKIFNKRFAVEGLKEDIVFEEIKLRFRLKGSLSDNAYGIIQFAFTEMLNNAIEHSQSKECNVEFILDNYNCSFKIRDYGIGLFYNVSNRFRLPDETAAVVELSKGKRTTMEERHTGEGIFFTSKVGDILKFRSHTERLMFDNLKQDVFVTEDKNFIKGTEVFFLINRRTKRRMEDVFEKYAPQEYDSRFERTSVLIKLLQSEYISRSEARRLLAGLEKFKEVILDFTDVNTIGQGFADEVFRVFKNAHPDIVITTRNLNPVLEAMVKHVVDNSE